MIQDRTQLVRLAQVCKQQFISNTTLIKSGILKAPIKISSRMVDLKSTDIENFINSRLEVSNDG